jgi:hypothetical protein
MTSPPSPRSRHRRRIVVATAVLVFGGALWWLTRPRIDPRLVGVWHHSNPVAVPPTEFTLKLNDDGTGTLLAVSHDPHFETEDVTTPISWWVKGDELLFRLQIPAGTPEPISRLKRVRIVQVTDRQVLFQRPSDDSDSEHLVLDRME